MVQKLRPWKLKFEVELNTDLPIYRQLADTIVAGIKKGRLAAGMPLPGTRQLAEDLGINRKTVVLAFEDLMAEGWLTTTYKKGTFVSANLPVTTQLFRQKKRPPVIPTFTYNKVAPEVVFEQPQKRMIVFDDGLPDVTLAPMDELARAYKRLFQQNARRGLMGYGNPKGTQVLRTAVASMLALDRGLVADADNILITRGSQMALYLAAHVLINKGDWIAIEDPGYAPAWQTFTKCGARLLPIKVDREGMCVEELARACKKYAIKGIYVTPHHQFPTTVSMKIDRRLQLLELANKYGFAIIEDDYDHEFHYSCKSLLPLASQELSANVIYISSLSKIVAPAVRTGYLMGPKDFIDAAAAVRKMIDVQGDNVMEHAVAELMQEGAIKKHAHRALTIYKQRRETMAELLGRSLGEKIHFMLPEGGLAFWVELQKAVDTRRLAEALLRKGVSVIPTEPFSFKGDKLQALRLGYASLTTGEMEQGLQVIAKVLE